MAIQYKKIIKKIVGPEAEKNGFVPAKLVPAGLNRRMLANYEKDFDETYSQDFSIELDTINSELELLSFGLSETRKFDTNEEDSFRSVINEFAQIMRDKGYALLEEDAAKPRFSLAENGYLLKNYQQLSEQFCSDNRIDSRMSFIDKICLINDRVIACRGKAFEEVKEELIIIAAFFTTTILECDGVTLYPTHGLDFCVLIQGNMGAFNMLWTIMELWLDEGEENPLKSSCFTVMSSDKFNAIDWKI